MYKQLIISLLTLFSAIASPLSAATDPNNSNPNASQNDQHRDDKTEPTTPIINTQEPNEQTKQIHTTNALDNNNDNQEEKEPELNDQALWDETPIGPHRTLARNDNAPDVPDDINSLPSLDDNNDKQVDASGNNKNSPENQNIKADNEYDSDDDVLLPGSDGGKITAGQGTDSVPININNNGNKEEQKGQANQNNGNITENQQPNSAIKNRIADNNSKDNNTVDPSDPKSKSLQQKDNNNAANKLNYKLISAFFVIVGLILSFIEYHNSKISSLLPSS